MDISENAWQQIRSITAKELIRALERDGWERESKMGATIGFLKGVPGSVTYKRIVVHPTIFVTEPTIRRLLKSWNECQRAGDHVQKTTTRNQAFWLDIEFEACDPC